MACVKIFSRMGMSSAPSFEQENREKTEVATMGSGEKSSVPKSEKLQNVRRQTHQRMKQQTAKKNGGTRRSRKVAMIPSSISLKRLDALSRLAGAVVLLPPLRRLRTSPALSRSGGPCGPCRERDAACSASRHGEAERIAYRCRSTDLPRRQ